MGWANVPGVGFIGDATVRTVTGYFGTRITRALVDATTGVTVETTKVGYTPPATMRRFVQERDGGCRASGCSRPASACELDHVIPWPAGETTPANLACLCKKHHQAKTLRHLRYTMDSDGVCTWTTSTGHSATTYPTATVSSSISA